jgi:hypothetical protein
VDDNQSAGSRGASTWHHVMGRRRSSGCCAHRSTSTTKLGRASTSLSGPARNSFGGQFQAVGSPR